MNIVTLQPSPRVLIVDDNADQLTLVSRLLVNAGFQVQTAPDAQSGFDLALREEPELVISDVTMPLINGFEFCNMIRGNETLSTTPVLLVSALQIDTESIVEGLHTGANDYLEIPYDPAVLIAKAHRLIDLNRVVEDLHKEKERMRFAIAAARSGLWEWNMVTGNLFWSDDLQKIHGMKPGDFGGDIESFIAQVHEEDREFVEHSLNQTREIGCEHLIQYRIVWPDGGMHWVEGRGAVIRNRRGQPVQMIGLCTDITERKEAETFLKASHEELEMRVEERAAEHRKLEEQLQQSQKLEAVGRLAGGIAHDFNNLLTAIIGYSQLSLRRLPESSPIRPHLDEIKLAGDRAAALTRQLLTFSRKQVLQPKVLDLNAIVSEMEKLLLRTIGEDIDLRTALGPNVGNVLADPSQMEQVIMNLVVNARDAMPQGGRLTIETTREFLDKSYAQQHVEFSPGPHVLLAVSDTGTGMDADTQEHLFEPFFTTKEEGKGTGLGLSTVYGIVKQSGGNIWVYSELGHGTTFKIYFPFAAGPADPLIHQSPSAELMAGTETILIVEDHEVVRRLVVEVLGASGYQVLEAESPEAALSLCHDHPENIQLLLTDVVMPGMSGRDVAIRAAALHPEMRILFMSGYADQAIVHHGVLDEGTNFIQKPFSPHALAIKVREVLDAD
jgi:PAS domain S-box-containing protein